MKLNSSKKMSDKNIRITNCPACIFVGVWTIAILIYSLVFEVISTSVLIYILLFACFFVTGATLASTFRYKRNFPHTTSASKLAFIASILVFINLFYALQVFILLLNSGSVPQAFVEIRQSALQGAPVIKNTFFYININQLLFGISAFGYVLVKRNKIEPSNIDGKASTKNNKSRLSHVFMVGVLTSLFVALLDGSRSFFLSALLALLFILYELAIVKLRQIIVLLLLVIIIFSATFSFFRPDAGDDLGVGFKYFALYFSGGLGSLDHVIAGDVKVFWNDLESVANKIGYLGLPFGGYDLTTPMDYVDLPDGYGTNVYTSLGVYYDYMGYFSLFFALFIGGLTQYFCWLSKRSALGLFVYSFCLSAIVLSIFHDYFVSFGYFVLKIFLVLFGIRILERFCGGVAFVFKFKKI